MDFVANDMKFDHFIIKQWGGRFKVWGSEFRVQGSGFRVQGCGGGFAAIFMGRCPKVCGMSGFPFWDSPIDRPNANDKDSSLLSK